MDNAWPVTPERAASFTLSGLHRSSRRITVTVPYTLHRRLVERADRQGRSISNLIAFLLLQSLDQTFEQPHDQTRDPEKLSEN